MIEDERVTTTSAPGTPTPTTSVPSTETAPVIHSPSSEACALADAWGMVETAFVATVASIEARPIESAFLGDGESEQVPVDTEWPWVTFDVDRWFTTDYGQTFSMWAPGFEGETGERWQIAGALYWVDEQSGEVFPCVSTRASDVQLAAWDERFGGSVPAGGGIPEQAASPELIAEIDQHRTVWEEQRPSDYTALIAVGRGDERSDRCGDSSQIRLVVEAGVIIQAVDLDRKCYIDDLATVPTVEGVFDLAADVAGAIDGGVGFNDDLGYIESFTASDGSVEAWANVELLFDSAVPVALGTDDSLAAAESAQSRWQASGAESYTMDLEILCFCTIGGRFDITVENGEAVSVVAQDGRGDPRDSGLDSVDYTVDGLFDLMVSWTGERADFIIAAFHESGYPLDVRIDAIENAIDDELTLVVHNLTTAG
jgi:hypothetical protein